MADWPFQFHHQRMVVDGLHPHPVWIGGVAQVKGHGTLDNVHPAGIRPPGGRI